MGSYPEGVTFMTGASDDHYGVGVWVARIENLRSHFKIIADHLPEDAAWLAGQVKAAMAEADRYIADCSPLAERGPA